MSNPREDLQDHLDKKNEAEIEHLALHGKDSDTIVLLDSIGSKKLITVQKGIAKEYKDHQISVLNKDDAYHGTVWITTPKKIKTALFSGIFDAERMDDLSPIAKMIACYGKYKKITAQRGIERGLKSKLAEKKIKIVDTAQESIWAFKDLHLSLNAYNEKLSALDNFIVILNKLNSLEENLKDIKQKLSEENEYEVKFENQLEIISANIIALKKKLESNFKIGIVNEAPEFSILNGDRITPDQVRDFLAPTGLFSLNHFIKDQLELINAGARKANNEISGLYDRGELFSCIVDAEIAHRKMNENLDYQNPYTPEMSLCFGDEKDETPVPINLNKFGAKVESDNDLTLQLEMLNQIEEHNQIQLGHIEESLAGLNWTDWEWDSIPRSLGRFGRDIITFVPDMFGKNDKGLYPSQRLWTSLDDNVKEKYQRSDLGKKIFEEKDGKRFSKVSKASLGSKVAPFVTMQFLKLTAEPAKEIFINAPKNLGKTIQRMHYDGKLAGQVIPDEDILFILDRNKELSKAHKKELDEEVEKQKRDAFGPNYQPPKSKYQPPHTESKAVEKNSGDEKNDSKKVDPLALVPAAANDKLAHDVKEFAPPISPQPIPKNFVHLPYQLNRDKPNDALSGAADGCQIVMEVFLDEIYGKHPLGGMAFTAAAAFGGVPSVLPAVSKYAFMKYWMTHINEPIAKTLVGDTEGFMAGFSTALIEGKIAFAVLDLKRGPNSILAGFIKGAVENPVVTILACGFAVGVGVLIAHDLHIPWLSAKLSEEAGGSFPYVELGLAGVKLVALAAEGLIDLSEEHERDVKFAPFLAVKKELRAQLEKTYDANYKEDPNKISLDPKLAREQHINSALKEIISWAVANQTLNKNYLDASKELQATLMRMKLAKVDTTFLNEKEKNKILTWTRQNYEATDPNFVDSVQDKLYKEKKSSPLATSFKKALDYTTLVVTAPVRAGYAAYYQTNGPVDPKVELANQSRRRQFANQVRTDTGLIVRAGEKALKYSANMLGTLVLSSVRIGVGFVALGLGCVESFFRVVFCAKSWKPHGTFTAFKAIDNGIKYVGNKVANFFSKVGEGIVGWFRRPATTKHVELAAHDATAKATLKAPAANTATYQSLLKVMPPQAVATTTLASKVDMPALDRKEGEVSIPVIGKKVIGFQSESLSPTSQANLDAKITTSKFIMNVKNAFAEFTAIVFKENNAPNTPTEKLLKNASADEKLKVLSSIQIEALSMQSEKDLEIVLEKIKNLNLHLVTDEIDTLAEKNKERQKLGFFDRSSSQVDKLSLLASAYKKLSLALYKLAPLVKHNEALHDRLLDCCGMRDNKHKQVAIAGR